MSSLIDVDEHELDDVHDALEHHIHHHHEHDDVALPEDDTTALIAAAAAAAAVEAAGDVDVHAAVLAVEEAAAHQVATDEAEAEEESNNKIKRAKLNESSDASVSINGNTHEETLASRRMKDRNRYASMNAEQRIAYNQKRREQVCLGLRWVEGMKCGVGGVSSVSFERMETLFSPFLIPLDLLCLPFHGQHHIIQYHRQNEIQRHKRRERERNRYHALDGDTARNRNQRRAQLERERYNRMSQEELEQRNRMRRDRAAAKRAERETLKHRSTMAANRAVTSSSNIAMDKEAEDTADALSMVDEVEADLNREYEVDVV
jgi:hypothetical protein